MPSAPPRDRPGVGTSGRLWGDFPGLMLGRWLESTKALWGSLGLATGVAQRFPGVGEILEF
jgi:hypothetical protein